MTVERRPADVTGCNCTTRQEHAALIARVDQSFLREVDRARERTDRTTTFLRGLVLAESNGHATVKA